jgi:hypothetical protein
LLVGGDTCHCRAKSFRNGEERMSRWLELGQHLASGTTKITERGGDGRADMLWNVGQRFTLQWDEEEGYCHHALHSIWNTDS